MNPILQITRARMPFCKDILCPTSWSRQISPFMKYSTDKELDGAVKAPVKKADAPVNKADAAVVEIKDDVKVPRNVYPHSDKFLQSFQKGSGDVYDTKPFKIRLKPGKLYFWCLCGRSHSQPLCDGTHRDAYRKTPYRPIRFTVEEDKEYWLCNCKQTKLRPFCDGTHKTLPPKRR